MENLYFMCLIVVSNLIQVEQKTWSLSRGGPFSKKNAVSIFNENHLNPN